MLNEDPVLDVPYVREQLLQLCQEAKDRGFDNLFLKAYQAQHLLETNLPQAILEMGYVKGVLWSYSQFEE